VFARATHADEVVFLGHGIRERQEAGGGSGATASYGDQFGQFSKNILGTFVGVRQPAAAGWQQGAPAPGGGCQSDLHLTDFG
jgi:hypothetical protein